MVSKSESRIGAVLLKAMRANCIYPTRRSSFQLLSKAKTPARLRP